MRAILVTEPGGVDVLRLGEHADPAPARGELLVEVRAAALNRGDILQRQGKYPAPPGASPLLGLEVSGVVRDVTEDCGGWRTGDRVCGLLTGGGYAEYAVLPAGTAIPVPENLTFEEAAAIPEAFLTAYQTLFWLGKLEADEWVLVHAGASGVGTAAIQLVREAAARAIVTAGSERKLKACLELGAEVAIDREAGDFVRRVLDATDQRGANLILDFVGATYWEGNLDSIAMDGRLILIGTLGGSRVDRFDLAAIMRKRVQVVGTTLRARSLEYKERLTRDFTDFAFPLFADARLKPVVDRVFRWEDVARAHRYMEENRNIGKIVLNGM